MPVPPLPRFALIAAAVLPCAPAAAADEAPQPIPVIRQGRYTLVELAPEAAQRHPMRQIVDVSIPPTRDSTVGEALRHVLQRSGYRLCDDRDTAVLAALPLPASHLRLGPMTLRHALETLAGPAWALSVDEVFRRVWFTRRMPELPVELREPPSGAGLAGARP
jgi:type IV pili sensor histidine kinase/response regulator